MRELEQSIDQQNDTRNSLASDIRLTALDLKIAKIKWLWHEIIGAGSFVLSMGGTWFASTEIITNQLQGNPTDISKAVAWGAVALYAYPNISRYCDVVRQDDENLRALQQQQISLQEQLLAYGMPQGTYPLQQEQVQTDPMQYQEQPPITP